MRLVFAGTPRFAEVALQAVHRAGHEVALVLTQPDRPVGRGMHPAPSAVKRLALQLGLPVFQPPSLKAPEAVARVREAQAQLIVVAAYGLILPPAVLNATPRGAINIHASLLPRWRGAAPIQRALLAGDRQTGVSIMQMDAGLDSGPVIRMHPLPIEDADDAGSLHDKLAELGAAMMVKVLEQLALGPVSAVPQPPDGIVYAAKIDKVDARIDWSRAAPDIERQVRAMRPRPGALTALEGKPLKVWQARTSAAQGAAGEVLSGAQALVVACGEGALELTELQLPGGRRLSAAEFLRGRPVRPGAFLR